MKGFNSHAAGVVGEDAACSFLISCGYTVIERNYRCPYGELDIIAEDETHIVFIEVKMRSDSGVQKRYGRPSAAVNLKKRERILNSVHYYIKEKKPSKKPRVDVVEILAPSADPRDFKITHIRAAFSDNV